MPRKRIPKSDPPAGRAVMAIHGHGRAEPCVEGRDDYHHMFALRLAQAGHLVLCPELRGFGALADMAHSDDGHWLDYWGGRRGGQFTLVTDGFLYGRTLIGETVEDLVNALVDATYVAGTRVPKNDRLADLEHEVARLTAESRR